MRGLPKTAPTCFPRIQVIRGHLRLSQQPAKTDSGTRFEHKTDTARFDAKSTGPVQKRKERRRQTGPGIEPLAAHSDNQLEPGISRRRRGILPAPTTLQKTFLFGVSGACWQKSVRAPHAPLPFSTEPPTLESPLTLPRSATTRWNRLPRSADFGGGPHPHFHHPVPFALKQARPPHSPSAIPPAASLIRWLLTDRLTDLLS